LHQEVIDNYYVIHWILDDYGESIGGV